MVHHRVLQVPTTVSQIVYWHRTFSTRAETVLAQQNPIDEGGHLVSYTVRCVQGTRIENGGFDARMVAPELVGKR